jgi:hypothetical protein
MKSDFSKCRDLFPELDEEILRDLYQHFGRDSARLIEYMDSEAGQRRRSSMLARPAQSEDMSNKASAPNEEIQAISIQIDEGSSKDVELDHDGANQIAIVYKVDDSKERVDDVELSDFEKCRKMFPDIESDVLLELYQSVGSNLSDLTKYLNSEEGMRRMSTFTLRSPAAQGSSDE